MTLGLTENLKIILTLKLGKVREEDWEKGRERGENGNDDVTQTEAISVTCDFNNNTSWSEPRSSNL